MFTYHPFQSAGDAGKAYLAFEKALHNNFVGGVQHASAGVVASGHLLAESQAGKPFQVRLFKGELLDLV